MKNNINKLILQTAGLGAIAGLRATVAPALLSHFFNKNPSNTLSHSKLALLQTPAVATVTKILSAVELTGDKLPYTPNRIALPQVLARVGSGAFVGATLFQANRQSVLKGALLGGAAALAATFISFYARKGVDKIPNALDPVTGAVEDVIAIGGGVALLK